MVSKRKEKHHSTRLFTSKAVWAVLVAAIICVIAVAAFSWLGGNNFQPISNVPVKEGDLLPGEHGNGSIDGDLSDASGTHDTTVKHDTTDRIDTYISPQMSKEEKLQLIEKKYISIFSNLESEYNRELDLLIESAKGDYIKGGTNASVSRIAMNYISEGRKLEKEADRSFNKTLVEMKMELQTHNLPLDIVKQAEREYKEQKSEMRKEILKQVASYVND